MSRTSGAGLYFGVTNGERERKISLAASTGLSIPGIYGQRTMTNEEIKRNVPHLLQAQQALVCGQYWKDAPMQ